MNENIIDFIRISKSKILVSLLKQNFSGKEIIDYALKLEVKKGKKILISTEDAKIEFEKAKNLKMEIIPFSSELYPEDLKQIANPPSVLYAKGNLKLLSKPKFAIVGARFSSFESGVLAQKFAMKLSEFGFTIVSGFAYGVDTFACKGAMEFGTIQVLGSGLDVIYPKQNTKLYEEVIEKGGLFLSELPPNSPAKPDNFPLRNRIISGISKGILLVQASKRNGSSGSLLTAKIALSQEKDLFAIPGHPFDPKFEGGNDLIKHGNAIFTTCPEDIIDLIGYHLTNKPKNFCFRPKNPSILEDIDDAKIPSITQPEDLKSEIKSILSTHPISIDEINSMLNIELKDLQVALIEMELLNELQQHHDGKFSISFI
jgi:DNA processing protein